MDRFEMRISEPGGEVDVLLIVRQLELSTFRHDRIGVGVPQPFERGGVLPLGILDHAVELRRSGQRPAGDLGSAFLPLSQMGTLSSS